MKSIFNKSIISSLVITAIIMAVVSQVTSCTEDVPETERVTSILTSHSWKVSTVTVGGTDQTSLFTGFTISFTGTNYNPTNGGLVWPSSSTWTFKDDTAKVLVRGDGLEVKLNEVTETSLKMELTWNKSTLGPGRISSISGVHIFSMTN